MIDRLAEGFATLLFRRTKTVIAVLVAIFVGAVAAATQLEFAEGIESFYDKKHPRQLVLNKVEQKFVHGRWLFVTYATDDIFSEKALTDIRALTDALSAVHIEPKDGEPIDPVADVLSLTTVKDIVPGGDAFKNVLLVPLDVPKDRAALDAIRKQAHGNPIIRQNLVGKDDNHGGIIIRFNGGLGEKNSGRAVDKIRELLKASAAKTGIHFEMTGMPAVDRDIPYITKVDTVQLTPIMLLIAAIILFISVRRMSGVLLVLGIVAWASVVAIGLVPLVRAQYNPLFSLLLPLVCIQCVTFTQHYLIEFGRAQAEGLGEDAARSVFASLLKPGFMCWFTTAIGFGSLALTPLQAIAEFGRVMAAALAVSGMCIPLIVAVAWKYKPASSYVSVTGFAVSDTFNDLMRRYLKFLDRNWRVVSAVAAALVLVFAYGAFNIRVGDSDIGYFEPDAPVHRGATAMEAQLGGATPIVVSIEHKDPDHFAEPANLQKLEEVDAKMRVLADVNQFTSVNDFLRLMNRAFTEEGDAGLRLPASREQVAQLLLINTDERMNEYIDVERRWVRAVARTPLHETDVLEERFRQVQAWLDERFPAKDGYQATATGEIFVFSLNGDLNARTQAQGLATSAIFIVLVFLFLFRSWRVGLYAALPNAFPIIITLGIMGWFGVRVSIGTAVIASITMGMVVDDTIHFVQLYRERVTAHGDTRRALEETYLVKGPATVVTAIIFTLGFLVFLLADLVPLQYFGSLSAGTMLVGVIGELTIAPCVIIATRSRLDAPYPKHDSPPSNDG